MRDKLKSFLKRSPGIYNFAKKGYFSFHSTLYRLHLLDTKLEERYWAMRHPRQALILLEWHCFSSKSNPLSVYAGHWMRDYVALLKEFVPERKIQVIKLPEELWSDENRQRYGGVVEVVM